MNAAVSFIKRKEMPRMIRRTTDFRRIELLAKRGQFPDYSEVLTEWLKTPNGTMKLRPVQAWALTELYECRGLMGNMPLGSGKSLTSLLAATVLGAQRPLLLVPATLREKSLKKDLPFLSQHWRIHPNLRVLSYEQLSQVKQAKILEQIMPDVMIFDECHKIAHKGSAVCRRVMRHYDEYPQTLFVGLTASMTRRSIRNYAHLLKLALRDNSPVPHSFMDLEDWADGLDEGIDDDNRPDMSLFVQTFCEEGENARQGFSKRLLQTAGYVSSVDQKVYNEEGAEISIRISELPVDVPQCVREAFKLLRSGSRTPSTTGNPDDGDVIMTALDFARHARELAMGFFYRWVWPDGKKDRPWLEARRLWRSFVRQTIKNSGRGNTPFDSELQVANACRRGELIPNNDEYNKWVQERERFTKQWKKPHPDTEAVWVSDFIVDLALDWMSKNEKGLVWVEHKALLERLREKGAICYGSGEEPPEVVGDFWPEAKSCVVSLAAHGEGRNLQNFDKNLFLAVSTSGKTWDQAIGRTHRSRQKADEIEIFLPLHCMELWDAFDQARRDAIYIEQTTTQRQRLTMADIIISSEKEVIDRALKKPEDPMWCTEWKTND